MFSILLNFTRERSFCQGLFFDFKVLCILGFFSSSTLIRILNENLFKSFKERGHFREIHFDVDSVVK